MSDVIHGIATTAKSVHAYAKAGKVKYYKCPIPYFGCEGDGSEFCSLSQVCREVFEIAEKYQFDFENIPPLRVKRTILHDRNKDCNSR